MKYLLVLLVVAVGAWMLFGRVTKRGERGASSAKAGKANKPNQALGAAAGDPGTGAEEMIACAHCGVHLPRGEATQSGALAYCSDTHRIAGPRPQ